MRDLILILAYLTMLVCVCGIVIIAAGTLYLELLTRVERRRNR